MGKFLSVDVNSLRKAKKITKARKGFYEILYGIDGKRIYAVHYRAI